MLEEAVWSVGFSADRGAGAGIALLRNGRICGGDGRYIYSGDYALSDNLISATLTLNHYAAPPNSVLGDAKTLTLKLKGAFDRNTFIVTGSPVQHPDRVIDIYLIRQAELSEPEPRD